jgi:hypothetical protein
MDPDDDSSGSDDDSVSPASDDDVVDTAEDDAAEPSGTNGVEDTPPDDVADDTTDDDVEVSDDTTDDSTPPVVPAEDASTSDDVEEPLPVDGGLEPLSSSPGTATLQLEVAPGQYCNLGPYCDGWRGHISVVRLEDGAVLVPATPPFCGYTPCSTCEAPACIGAGCLPTPREVDDEGIVWDGAYQEPGSCDANSSCHTLRYAPPGRYLARMCATPGAIVAAPPDDLGDETTCEAAGPLECDEVEFEFPSSDPVVGELPAGPIAQDAGMPAGAECEEDADCASGGGSCCDGRCVNLYNDPQNCGACNVECSGDESYCAGSCQAPACAETCGGDQVCCLIMEGPWAALCSDLEEGTCPVGCPECVCAAPDTPIATERGQRRIDEIEVGDLVYSIDHDAISLVPVIRVQRTPVRHHRVIQVRLATGAVLEISGPHPTAHGDTFADLTAGGELDGVKIESVTVVPYLASFTHDILPASSTGTYFAAGVAIGSTLHGRP